MCLKKRVRPPDQLPALQDESPRQADLACGNWGVIGDKAGSATFVEVCSRKVQIYFKKQQNQVKSVHPCRTERRRHEEKVGAMHRTGDKWRTKDFKALGPEFWGVVAKETARCIKCYSCIENCPVCDIQGTVLAHGDTRCDSA